MRAGGSGPEQDRWIEGVFGGVGSGSAGSPLETTLTGALLAVSVQALTNTGSDSAFWASRTKDVKASEYTHTPTNKQNMVNAKSIYEADFLT